MHIGNFQKENKNTVNAESPFTWSLLGKMLRYVLTHLSGDFNKKNLTLAAAEKFEKVFKKRQCKGKMWSTVLF